MAWACFASLVHAGVPEGLEAYSKFRFTDARKELTEPAAAGDLEAMAVMGEMLLRGQGGVRDELKAREYIMKAYDGGNPRATSTLGQLYLTGNLVNKDEAKGVELVKRAAEQKNPAAMSIYGTFVARGSFGIEKNEATAVKWYRESAALGDSVGMSWLADAYEYGKGGLTADSLTALDWYKKSGEKGNTSAMVAAGRMYASGKGVTPEGQEALRWFRKAVAYGNLSAYVWMGGVYEMGRPDLNKNPALAYAWYSALPGNVSQDLTKAAQDGRERLVKVLSSKDIEDAAKLGKTLPGQIINAELVNLVSKANAAAANPPVQRGIFGSGSFVSRKGDVLTNEHVIRGCEKIRINPQGLEAKLVAKDAVNDLALLRVEGAAVLPLRVRSGRPLRLGEELVAIGYPLRGLLSSGPIVTTGIVNALSGVNDDTSAFQMSATVQHGSSGGPIVDNTGALTGVVRSRIEAVNPVGAQNVNFGINTNTVIGFLDSHAVEYQASPSNAKPQSVADVTAQAQKSTVGVECY